eukprot:623718-Pleurochrysis_carterae.AAC.1
MQTDHANTKEMKEDVHVNVVWESGPSSRTAFPRNQRCPRSARKQTSSLFLRKRGTFAWT